jgi:hypothetical protein
MRLATAVRRGRQTRTVLHTSRAGVPPEVFTGERHSGVDADLRRRGYRPCGDAGLQGGHMLYWLMVAVMAGVGFGWVQVRRRRKAEHKTA